MNTANDIEEKLQTLPDKSGVYIMHSADGTIIYVGKAKILKNRVRQYFKNHNHPPKVARMVENVADFEYIITDNEQEALILENNLIKENMPKYNILLKDDKTYPFIKVTVQEDYPRIFMTRRILRDGAKYFGPYCSNFNLKELLELIGDAFSLRKCKKTFVGAFKTERPCLYYQMGKCLGVCTGTVPKEQYRTLVNEVIAFLNGKYDKITDLLTQKMKQAAENLDFETAAQLRDRLNSLSLIGEKQKIVSAGGSDRDAMAVYNANNCACVEVFFVRSGKIVGREHYFLQDTDDIADSEILSDFMKQYYEDCTFIPNEILLQSEIEDAAVIEQWLTDKTGKSVKLAVPKIGDKLKLMHMIYFNAKKEHSERELKMMRDISFKDNALTLLQKAMQLDNPPLHIEAYDISNLSGTNKVGAMVTFKNGKASTSDYKNFKIKYVAGQDDYACMKEVLSRRLERGLAEKKAAQEGKKDKCSFYPFPDVILLDGGKGHVDAVLEVFRQYDIQIPLFGIYKDERHRTRGLISPDGNIDIDKNSEAFMLLIRIQDEMHRRAITYHQKLRQTGALKSELLEIRGVGPKKAAALLRQFKSMKAIKNATAEELASAAGIDAATAQSVAEYFLKRT